jgi:hypothetical protein
MVETLAMNQQAKEFFERNPDERYWYYSLVGTCADGSTVIWRVGE